MNTEHFLIAFITGIFFLIAGAFVAEGHAYNNCIEYHNQMTVVEANKTCDAILKKK